MADVLFTPTHHIHIIGIGGTGMSAIARILLQQGYRVSGSDRQMSHFAKHLQAEDAIIHIGHDAAHIQDVDVVIATSAAPDDHIEIVAAKKQGIPVYRRQDVMQTLMQGKTCIAVAGTHGKTTTTSMTTHILVETGQHPSYIIGAVTTRAGEAGSNAEYGTGQAFVIEADEYGYMFLGLRPQVAVLTSVEYDHPDFFESPTAMHETFSQFVALLPDDGLLIACADDAVAGQFARYRAQNGLPVETYGIKTAADWQATNIRYEAAKTIFDVQHDGKTVAQVSLSVPGKHNILNALAALIVANHEGVPTQNASDALVTFEGAGRRFDLRADIDGIAIIDDYAHHPTAIATTIDAARTRYPDREIWAVWQPHTYSRTRALWGEFLGAFGAAHHVIITDIYASREAHDPSVNLEEFVTALTHPDAYHTPTFADVVAILSKHATSPAVVLIMSAGDAPQIGTTYQKFLEANTP